VRALRLLAIGLPCLLPLPAHAQTYKCTQGDTTTYSEAPCERGTQTVLPAPAAPASPPAAAPSGAGELQRLQKEAAALQKERLAREAQQARADARHDREAAHRREACAKLAQARKWAEDDARRASHRTAEAARLKAGRAAERHAAECQ
jgi:hypothetical protein